MYDVIIVGGGPAGLFAAYSLSTNSDLKVCLIEMGSSIDNRPKNHIMKGFGGAGTFSDGKLHFTPILSHEKMLDLFIVNEYQEYLNEVDEIFKKFGDDSDYYPKNLQEVKKLVEDAEKKGIQLFIRKVKHVGSDKLPGIIKNFENFLNEKNVEILTETKVEDIVLENNSIKGVLLEGGKKLESKYTIICPGRIGASWMQSLAKKYNLKYDTGKIEVGVRVEFPSSILKTHSELMYEPIFSIHTPTFDDRIRTFCPCPNGHVATEDYEGFVCVNGHSNSDHLSKNSNFAFVSEILLTEPVENTIEYAKSIAQLASTIGGGKPILQRLSDLKKGRRSTWNRINKSYVIPSLKEVTPGDISMALPFRVVKNIREGLEELDKVLPGINSESTLLYAPEIKLRSSKIKTAKYLETEIQNLFVAGDGAGVSGNIVGAAATGLIAAKGILNKH